MRQIASTELIQSNIPLENAFHAFNEVSERLTESYQLLEQQVIGLTAELSEANTEKLKFLSEKEQLADQLECMLESLPGAVIVLNDENMVIKANACARGWLTASLIGKSWGSIEQSFLVGSEQLDNEYLLQDNRVIALSRTTLQSGQGFVILLSDITQQRELHQKLEHKEKLAAMGKFSAGLAHQIRTPLSSALLYASQLNSGLPDAELGKKYSTKLLERLRHINNQVSDMLGYAHKGHFRKAVYNLQNIAFQLTSSYQSKPANITFETQSIRNNISVQISKDALIGAIDNLINNALEAGNADGEVRCLIETVNEGILSISVSDQGVGLPSSEVAQIFEPFYTNKAEGTGLGLAVVKEIVNAHGGHITCDSTEGVGTTFTMLLPVVMVGNVMKMEETA
jgi:two-component system sensor histidine kinase FlrB